MSSIIASVCPESTPRNPLPRVVCTNWCERGDGHPNETFHEDQVCMGASGTTPLGWSGDKAEAFPIGTTGGEARVNVGFEQADGAMSRNLTVVQALMHAEHIRTAAAVAAAHNAGLSR